MNGLATFIMLISDYFAHISFLADIGSFMMTEARQHNTEIRLAVARVTDKVDYLASKVQRVY